MKRGTATHLSGTILRGAFAGGQLTLCFVPAVARGTLLVGLVVGSHVVGLRASGAVIVRLVRRCRLSGRVLMVRRGRGTRA